MNKTMRLLVTLFAVVCIAGCGSTAKRDDFVTYTKSQLTNEFNNIPSFYFDGAELVDVRGEYSKEDAIEQGNIMYSADAGVAGLLAQIATHAVINESARSGKLAALQEKANEVLLPFEPVIQSLKLINLVNKNSTKFSVLDEYSQDNAVVKSKPIFFVAQDLSNITLKNIVWVDKKSKRKKSKFLYSNMIQVSSRNYTKQERRLIREDNGSFLEAEFGQLLNASLAIASKDISGEYASGVQKTATFKFLKGRKKNYLRGAKVDTLSNNLVLRNLRSWLIVLPEQSIVQ